MYISKFFKAFPSLKPKSLKAKFIAYVLPPVTACFLAVSLIGGYLSYHDMEHKILDRYENDISVYIKPLSLTLWNMDNSVIQSQVQSILKHPDVTGVKVKESVYGQIFSAGDIPKDIDTKGYLSFSRDIVYIPYNKTEVLGTLYFYLKKKQIFNLLIKQFFQYSLLFFILVLTVIFSAMFSYHKTIDIPLKKLLESIRKFDQDKKAILVEWTPYDEIGQVISAYNGLIVSLEMGNSQLRNALVDAKQANAAKSEFLANMSHEIRTPLNGIQGLADIILDTQLNIEQKKYLETIYMESEQLLTIINDILDFSKIEAGMMEIDQIPFDLRHTLESLCASLSVQADKKGLELIHYIESTFSTMLIGDPGRLRQILINLIGNAIKFTHSGEVFVNVTMVKESERNILFRFSVKDTGIGIPDDKQDKIFDSFSQADSSTTRNFGGTGLGITICKMLIEQMGGFIALQSTHGVGTEFYFELELIKQKSIGQKAKLERETKSEPEAKSEQIDFSDLTILVVDDVKTNLKVFSDYLESWGCDVLTAQSGEKALNVLDSYQKTNKKIAAIFIDHGMPGMNGFELSKRIRGINHFSNTPIGVLSSMGVIGDGKQYREIGVNGYLIKPVCQEDLKTFITYILGQGISSNKPESFLITRHTIAETRRKNTKVLLVEDYATNQQLTTKQLETAGFKVTLASDGQEAVDYCSQQNFDVILMDIQMPKMDGYEACNLIREMEGVKKRTPIIAMTAHALQGYKKQCLEAGMDDYVTKPLKKEILLSTVSKWVQNTLDQTDYESTVQINDIKEASFQDKPPLNIKTALHEFDNDTDFFYQIFDQFLIHVKKQITILKIAIDQNDFKTLRNEAHSIKGGAANLTAIQLANAASDLETFGKTPQKGSGKKRLDHLIIEVEKLSNFRNQLTKNLQ